jgi:hypothetical protein
MEKFKVCVYQQSSIALRIETADLVNVSICPCDAEMMEVKLKIVDGVLLVLVVLSMSRVS